MLFLKGCKGKVSPLWYRYGTYILTLSYLLCSCLPAPDLHAKQSTFSDLLQHQTIRETGFSTVGRGLLSKIYVNALLIDLSLSRDTFFFRALVVLLSCIRRSVSLQVFALTQALVIARWRRTPLERTAERGPDC